jgi:hypothetical protein
MNHNANAVGIHLLKHALRDDIVAMIVGRRSADALKRLTETGFKCNILTF